MSHNLYRIKNTHKLKYVIARVFPSTRLRQSGRCFPKQFPVLTRRLLRTKSSQRYAHIGYCCFLALALLLASLFIQVDAGNAQEPTASVTAEGVTPTPTAAAEIVETGTTVPAALSRWVELVETESQGEVEADKSRLSDASSRILVTITSRARIANVMERVKDYGNVIEMEELSKLGAFIMDVPSENLAERIQQVQNSSGVLQVEPDHWAQAADTFPNDPGFVNQYALTSIRAPQGWDLSTGSSSITIAILDSGVDLGHVDLAGKLVGGYDFVNTDFIPQDDYGHGTHVAGIAAASGNNGAGIAGVSWGARIMPLKVLNSSGGGSYSNVAAGIVWAVDHGAQVINLSLGGASPSLVLQNAVIYAYNHNVLMAASAGNTGSAFVLYPARYPQVMAVGASNMSNQPASFSNYGAEVDIAAPGENIYSLWLGGYLIQSGTSMSAPHVSGLAAVLLGYVNSADSVRSIIESTALDIGPAGWDLYSGAGLIQMDAALALALPRTATPTFLPTWTSSPLPSFMPTPITSNLPGFLPRPAYSLPTWTSLPVPSPKPAATTQTVSPLREAEKSTPALMLTPTQAPLRVDKLERLKIFLSPYFCGALLMILLGAWLFWRGRRRKKHNKIVR